MNEFHKKARHSFTKSHIDEMQLGFNKFMKIFVIIFLILTIVVVSNISFAIKPVHALPLSVPPSDFTFSDITSPVSNSVKSTYDSFYRCFIDPNGPQNGVEEVACNVTKKLTYGVLLSGTCYFLDGVVTVDFPPAVALATVCNEAGIQMGLGKAVKAVAR